MIHDIIIIIIILIIILIIIIIIRTGASIPNPAHFSLSSPTFISRSAHHGPSQIKRLVQLLWRILANTVWRLDSPREENVNVDVDVAVLVKHPPKTNYSKIEKYSLLGQWIDQVYIYREIYSYAYISIFYISKCPIANRVLIIIIILIPILSSNL